MTPSKLRAPHFLESVLYILFIFPFNFLPFLIHSSFKDDDDPSLVPPLVILDHTQVLREIMAVYQSSLLGDEDEDEINAGFNQVLDIMVDPVVVMCLANGEEKKKVRPRWDEAVFVLNCLCYLQVRAPRSFLSFFG